MSCATNNKVLYFKQRDLHRQAIQHKDKCSYDRKKKKYEKENRNMTRRQDRGTCREKGNDRERQYKLTEDDETQGSTIRTLWVQEDKETNRL